jgi:hypothetical protein
MPPSIDSTIRLSNLSYCAPCPSGYGYAFELLHFVEVYPAWNTRLLYHFPVRTLQKVQALSHMGYVDRSTPLHDQIGLS